MTESVFDEVLLQAGAVSVARTGSVLKVTLNNPDQRNAQTPATWAALAHVGAVLPGDVAVVILSGAGTSFSAGMDRRMFSPQGIEGYPSLADVVADGAARGPDIIGSFQEAFAWWRTVPAITISAVQWHAVGAGFQLALATDLMLVASDVQMIMKESAFGLVPDLAGTHPLISAVGYRAALEICLTARPVGAQEAVERGLAVRSVAPAELEVAASELAATIAALAPGTASATKQLLSGAIMRTHDEQRHFERVTQIGRLQGLLGPFGG